MTATTFPWVRRMLVNPFVGPLEFCRYPSMHRKKEGKGRESHQLGSISSLAFLRHLLRLSLLSSAYSQETSTHEVKESSDSQDQPIVSHLPHIPVHVVVLERLAARSAFEDGVKNDGGELSGRERISRDGRARRSGRCRKARWREE